MPLALREEQARNIVAGLRVIWMERKDLLVKLDRLVRLSAVLVPDCLAEQVVGRRPRRRGAGSGGVNADGSTLHAHGSALFSIH
jgi:hypothetical protein